MLRGVPDRKRFVLKLALIPLGLVLAACLLLGHFLGGPADVYGFLRYALPQWHEGGVRVGDHAPDAQLFSLDGQQVIHLRDWIGRRPLVLIFGSYT